MAVAALLALGVSACAQDDKKTMPTIPVPEVYISDLLDKLSYPEGRPAGGYEDNPWVQVARSYEAEYNWATVQHDWTSVNLLKVAKKKTVSSGADWQAIYAKQGYYQWLTPAGPTPFRVLRIDSSEPPIVVVTVCQGKDWYVTKTNAAPTLGADGKYVHYYMSIDKDGYGKVDTVAPDRSRSCNVDGIVPSYFDPLPTYTEISPDDVKITPWIEKELDRSK